MGNAGVSQISANGFISVKPVGATSPLFPPQYLCIRLIGLFCGRRKNCLGGGYLSWPSYAGLCFRVGCGGGIFVLGWGLGPGFEMRGWILGD